MIAEASIHAPWSVTIWRAFEVFRFMLTTSLSSSSSSSSSYHAFPSDIQAYRLYKLIGRGAFGQVYEASVDGHVVAVKIVDKLLLHTPEMMKRIRNEREIHASLSHPNILALHHHFEDSKAVYLVMELCEHGELYSYLRRRKQNNQEARLSEQEAKPLFVDVCRGLDYLHRRSFVIHRDLKLSNIMLATNTLNKMVAKIGDFGLACRIMDHSKNEQLTICGTPNYLAPEIIQKRPYGREADLWSLGCLLYTMLVGRAPFEGRDMKSTFAKVNAGHFSVPDYLSMGVRDLLNGLIRPDCRTRWSLEQVMEHPYLTSAPPILSLPGALTREDTLNTNRLKPLRQTIRHGTIEIDLQGCVIFTVDSDQSVMTVSKDGKQITFQDRFGRSESCKFHELGRAARKRYDYMRRFVDLVRSKTPFIILRTDHFKMIVYELMDVNLHMPQGQIAYKLSSDSVQININSQVHEYYHPTYRTVENIDDALIRKWLMEFLGRLEQLKRVMEALKAEEPCSQSFPFVIDECASMCSPQQPLSSCITSIKSFSTDNLSGISGLKLNTSSPPISKFIIGIGWMVEYNADCVLLLSNHGKSVHVNRTSRQVLMGNVWIGIQNCHDPTIKDLLKAFSDYCHFVP